MDMFVAGGGIDGVSCGADAVFFFWLKRRSRDVLRTGRESAVLPANVGGAFTDAAGPDSFTGFCDCEDMCVTDGGSEDESGGLGKLLRAGS